MTTSDALNALTRSLGLSHIDRGSTITISALTSLCDGAREVTFEYHKDKSDPMGYWIERK